VSYEIDLSNSNANTLRAALTPFVSAARRTGGRRIKVAVGQATNNTTSESQATDEYTAVHDIRSWARDHGHDVSNRGRIPASIVDAYNASRDADETKTPRKPRAQPKSQAGPKRSK
jgi:hypothetical protein